MAKKRIRDCKQEFFVTPEEEKLILEKMEAAGIKNKSAYLRKMVLDGYIIKQDFSVIRGVIYELNKIGVNLNQMTKAANTYGDVYLSELKKIKEDVDKIWQLLISKASK